MLELTLNHFLARDGFEKKNCAQAILCGFQEQFKIEEGLIESFKAYGGGRAPEGMCGAMYGAEHVLKIADQRQAVEGLLHHFESQAGSSKCKAIKEAGKMSCADCVAMATKYLLTTLGTQSEVIGNDAAV